jgi:DNA-binding transcriptional ArsR family regulator
MHGVGIGVSHLRETAAGISAEISIEHTVLGPIHWGGLNLASTSAREALVGKLRRMSDAPPWAALLERVCRMVAEEYRKGVPIIALEPAPARETRDLIEKMLPLGETAVLHGDGGSGKSLSGMTLAIAATTETTLPGGLRPTQRVNVLYLDYESTAEEHQERLHALIAGLGVKYHGGIYYRPMVRALADEAPLLRAEISRLGIGLVIVDSLAPACGPEPEGADAVIRTLNALRSFAPATRLATAHISKAAADQRGGSTRPFGSVFVQNLARSVWEIRAAEDADDENTLAVGLYHRKANRGRRHPPFGLRFEFADGLIRLRAHDLAEHTDLLIRTSMSYRLRKALAGGSATVEDLAEATDADAATVRRTLNRLRSQGKVIRLDDVIRGKACRWGLAAS